MTLRREDFSLSDEQKGLRRALDELLAKHSTSEVVRAAEPTGFDPTLWRHVTEMRLVAMAVPEAAGGDGAGIVDMAIVAESLGRRAAPVPVIESVVAGRALAGIDSDAARDALAQLLSGAVGTYALGPVGPTQLVPAAAVASVVVGRQADAVVVDTSGPFRHVINMGSAPLGEWTGDAAVTIVAGDDAAAIDHAAQTEWRILAAATMVGLGQSALDQAVQYAKDRSAFGVPIGSFQAVAHPLADVATLLATARRLTHRAAWFHDNEPEAIETQATFAYLAACQAALRAGEVGIHTEGGVGFTLESDQQVYYRRARTWASLTGGRRAETARLAAGLYGPVGGRP